MPACNYSRPQLTPRGERIYELMLRLVAIPSITGSDGGENECARFIYEWLSHISYFQENTNHLRLLPLRDDPRGRQSVFALLKADRPTPRTVILTGHFDVVDIDVCGPIRSWAFDPEAYTNRIGELTLSDDARRDLESGNYLFDRGVADMKAGVAINLSLLEEYASERENLDFNVLLLLVPDEEGDSTGMRLSLPSLLELQEKEGLDFVVCIDTEPVLSNDGPGMYLGTIGKIMPFFLCVGRETHVGDYAEGLNSTLIASCLNLSREGGRAETFNGQTFPPDYCLYLRDLRGRYAVTLPERTAVYYNCLTVTRTPASILEEMKNDAEKALRSAFDHVGRRDWPVRVLEVEEVFERAAATVNLSRAQLTKELLSKVSTVDERDRNIEFLSLLLDRMGEKGPLVVAGFLPPYYPARCNEGRTPREQAVREAAGEIRRALSKQGWGFSEVEIFQGISDLSYTGFHGSEDDVAPLAANMPLWSWGYAVSLKELMAIDIPSVLLGPIGADAHKLTERLELRYSMDILPGVIRDFLALVVQRDASHQGRAQPSRKTG